MTRKEALQELKMGAWPGGLMHKFMRAEDVIMAYDAYNGSMDAALSLFEAVLPGWVYGLNMDAHNEKYAFVSFGSYETDECYSDVHSRALLIAILEALVAMEDG